MSFSVEADVSEVMAARALAPNALQAARSRNSFTAPAAKYVARRDREDQDVAELMALITKMAIIERSSSDPESRDRRLERIEKAIKQLHGEDARNDTLQAAVEAADGAEDLEYEVVPATPTGELTDDEDLGGRRCSIM